jgi:EmrB/QacA subfamily drug resistance transporter
MTTPHRSWWALGALSLAMLTIGLDTTVLTVALPTLAVALPASTDQLQWFGTAYTLVLAAALLPAGMLGDRFGRKRLLVGALTVFGLASAACAFAGSAGTLIAARAVLGLGAAVMMPLSMAVLPVLFPDSAARGRALSIWIMSTAIGLPLGPIVGGWLLDTFWWGSVFLINVPLVALGIAAVALLVPESRSARAQPLDVPGVLLSSAGLLALTYGFVAAGRDGWTSTAALVGVPAGLLLLGGFVAWQRRAAHPLIDLGLFADPGFRGGTLLSMLVNFAMFGLLFALPQYFQAVAGADALGSGLRLLPMIGGLIVGTRLIGLVARGRAPSRVIAAGFALLAVALLVGARTGLHTGYGWTAGWLTLLGIGMGAVMPTAMAVAMDALSAERAGSGTALMQALRQVGGTVGVAVLGTVLSTAYLSRLPVAGVPAPLAEAARDSVSAGVAAAAGAGDAPLADAVRAAFVHGMDTTLLVCAVVAALAAVVSPLVRSRPAPVGDAPQSAHELAS